MGIGRNGHLVCVVLENIDQFSYLLEMVKSSPLASLHSQETKKFKPVSSLTDRRAAERQELTLDITLE